MNKQPQEGVRDGLRGGVTLVEVLVTISVLTLLLALLLPAIHGVRESARRTQCLDHLRQLALASHAHSASYNEQFPFTSTNGSDWEGKSMLPSHSPHVYLLPFLGLSALHTQIDFKDMSANDTGRVPGFLNDTHRELLSASVPVFLCPADQPRAGATNYRANLGYGPGLFGPAYVKDAFEGNGAGAFVHGRRVPVGEFRDGTSNTVLFSERLIGDGDRQHYTPWTDFLYFMSADVISADEAVRACRSPRVPNPDHASHSGWTWIFGGWNSTWYNHILTPNSALPDCSAGGTFMAGGGPGAYAARSFHRGGVNAALADGSGRFISEQIDLSVWRALSSRDGGNVLGGVW